MTGQFAIIHVRDGDSEAWPVVERVRGGWQSGAHHYPDVSVIAVQPLTAEADGSVLDVERAEEWAVFCGHPLHPDGEDIVTVFDELAAAEELAHRVIDAHIGRRWVSTTRTEWEVVPWCGSCGSVLDGELCCDGRRGETPGHETCRPPDGATHDPV